MYCVYFCSEREYTCVKLNTMRNVQNVHKDHRGRCDSAGGAQNSAELEFCSTEHNCTTRLELQRALQRQKSVGKRALLQLFNDFAPSRCSEGSSPASSLQVVIWELKVWGIRTDLKTPSPRYQLEMFCHFEDAGIRDTGRSFHCHYLWMVLRLCSQVLVTPFLRLSAPLPKFQKSVVLSPQRRSRWSQAWLDWTRPIPEFIKSSLSFVSTNKQSLKAAFPDLSEHFLSASPMSRV